MTDKLSKNDILIILGNGPSLANQNFELIKNFDTFGLNVAYRKYRDMNFTPTYYGCFDFVVCEHHKNDFKKLIDENKCDKYFFARQNCFKEYFDNPKFIKFNLPINAEPTKLGDDLEHLTNLGCSGSIAAQCGIIMGYKKIILLGCDCNYVEIIPEAEKSGQCLKITKTPDKNPNYWFNDYQKEGDVYNVPRANKYHFNAWQRLNKYKPQNVDIVNCSNISKITYFRLSTLEKELEEFL